MQEIVVVSILSLLSFAATRHSALIILFVELHFSDMDVIILRNYIYNTMFHYTVLRLDMGK